MKAPTLPELAQRLDRIDLNAKALWGKMDLAQMLVHCRMPMESGLGERQVKRVDNFFLRSVIFPLLMRIPWPKGRAQTHPEFNVVKLDLPVRSVAEEATALAGKLKIFITGGFDPKPHPIFGELSRDNWFKLQRKHLDHHFRQFGL
jgi:Protein of unknown function (DUF1569)